MEFWQKPSFLALQEAWYQRLRDDGFVDIEHLSDTSLKRSLSSDPDLIRAREAYFRLIEHFVSGETFTKDIDRVVMTMHSKGSKIVEIQYALEKLGTSRTRGAIRFRIRKFEMKWGIRIYGKKDLHLE